MPGKSLYDNEVYFKLTVGSAVYFINEPVSWDKVELSAESDPDFFGAVYEFIDADLSVGFASDDGSYGIIKDVLNTKGQDGDIKFEFGIIQGALYSVLFTGNVNLNIYSEANGIITATIEKTNFESLYRTRFDTPVTLTDINTLDGVAMVPPQSESVKLHSKKLSKLFIAEIKDPISASSTGQSLARFLYIDIDTSTETASEVSENQGLQLNTNGINPIDDSRYFFKITEAGSYSLEVTANFVLIVARKFGIGNYSYAPVFRLQRGGAVIQNIIYDKFTYSGGGGFNAIMNVAFTCTFAGDLMIGDHLYFTFEGQASIAGSSYDYSVNNYTSKVTLQAQTTAPATQCKMYTLYNAISNMLESTTGRQNALISKFLAPGGCGGMYYITNGYQIRNFAESDKPIIDNLKRALTSISGIEGLGAGITTINGLDYLVIEPLEYFYQNKEVILIKTLMPVSNPDSRDEFEYHEENAKEFVFNEYEIGYNKFLEDELNTLDEFNTYQTGLFPIKTYKALFSKKVDYITSGYSIESIRREQFKENPSTSVSGDDDIYLISCIQGPSGIEAERDQNFTNITGLLSPETAYNLKFRPKRMLYNWSPYLNIMLWAKQDSDIIKNTFVKDNGDLSLKQLYDCQRYGPAGITREGDDINIPAFKSVGTRLHLPINAYFKSPLNYEDALTLKRARIGENNVDNSYGYIVHPDDKGVLWKSRVYSFKYTPSTEVAEFRVAKIEPYFEVVPIGTAIVILKVTEHVDPYIDSNGQLKINGIENSTINDTNTFQTTVNTNQLIRAIAFVFIPSTIDNSVIKMIITDDNGNIIFNDQEPANMLQNFYKDFYPQSARTYTIDISTFIV